MPYFIKDNYGGGAEVQAYLTAKSISKLYEVYYITSNPLKKNNYEIFESMVIMRVLKNTSIYAIFDFPKIVYYLFKLKPDIVYLRVNYPFLLPVGIVSKIIKSKTIWFSTEDITIDRFYHTKNFFKYLRNYKKFYKVPILFLNYLLYDICFSLGIYLMDKRIVQNGIQKAKLKKIFNLDSEIVYSIIEVSEESFEKSKEPIVLWVSHFGQRKRPELFLKIARRLPNYKFIIIGKDSPNFPKEEVLKDKPDNLIYLGGLSLEETNEYFKKSWIFVNTSDREGFPNTFLQAFKYKSVVVSLEVDPDNILTNNKIGFVVGNIDNAIEIIEKLVKDEELRNDITNRAYEYLLKHHSINNILEFFK
ncbi:MAG: glycosyltransferase family 4 protein [candidate division WOR-3 bacterium]|nr:glycosyltransferase family 4 protein [candidate division WOR-3 bacterium]MCX7948352.1 glycosyltransferase family 4 protein [candidate division WOR-3 bacterium]MDW8151253.1 glycosyltransferase family 4 protein [candidate division WOR-3 bacterium]